MLKLSIAGTVKMAAGSVEREGGQREMKPMKRQIAEAFPPGDMLQEKLEELGMPIKEFALRCGKPEPTIHDVLKGRSAVTPDMAILFEKVLGIPARLWLNLQCQYDEYKARLQHDEELQKDLEWVKLFPFADMVEKGYIQAEKRSSPLEKLQTILSFFGFAKTNVWGKYYQCQTLKAEFRISLAGMPDAYALSAWLRYGENKAQEIHDMPEYTSEGLKALLPRIINLANDRNSKDFLPQLIELCRQAGIILVCTPHLTKNKARGATRWLKDTPLLQVADTYKRYDIFWFSFFHEIGHIMLHGKRDVFLEGIDYEQKQSQKEQEADDFAANCLIPKHVATHLTNFAYSDSALEALCQKEHLHTSFVVGRLRYLNRISQSVGAKYITSVNFISTRINC